MATYHDMYMSNVTNSTANREVEAKETEIANTHLDADAERSCSATPCDCPSYLQVVVEKHRQRSYGGASSPAPAPAPAPCTPARVPKDPSLHCVPCGCGAGDSADADAGRTCARSEAECVEVYRFLRVGRSLAAGAGAGAGVRGRAVWRASARTRRRARALAAEAGAASRLALAAPLQGAVLALRWSLQLARDAAHGALAAASDYALKPALALAYNALLHPLLVFVGNVLQGASAATRPACEALGECARHAATVLSALRLVAVTVHAPPRSPAALHA